MALEEPRGVDLGQELEVAAAGVAEDHREAMEVVAQAVFLDGSEGGEVDLSLNSRRGLEAGNCENGPVALERPYEVLDGGVASAVAAFPEFLEETHGAQVILGEASPQVVLKRIDGARARTPSHPGSWRTSKEECADGVAVHAHRPSDLADGHLLCGKLSSEGLLFDSQHGIPPPHLLLLGSDDAGHFRRAGCGQSARGTDSQS